MNRLMYFAYVITVILACIYSNNANFVSNCSAKGRGSLQCYCNSNSAIHCSMELPPDIKKFAVKELTINGQMDIIPSIIFIMFPNLLLLNASNCEVRNVHFENQSRLTQLDVSHNLIKELPAEGFKGLPKLTELDLSYNAIETMDSKAFEGIRKLEKLNLSHNQIKSLGIIKMNWLKVLLLNNNFIINYNPIENLSSLKLLDFSNNPLKYAHDNNKNGIFANLTNLTTIILKSTNLNDANDELFESFSNIPNLEYIDISENDWECTNLNHILQKFNNLNFSETKICTNKTTLTNIKPEASKVVHRSSSSIISNTPSSINNETSKVVYKSSISIISNTTVWAFIGFLTILLLVIVVGTYVILKRRRSGQYDVTRKERESPF